MLRLVRRSSTQAAKLTHIDGTGRARMVDVGGKMGTMRTARARAIVELGKAWDALVQSGKEELVTGKGDVFSVARIAGVQAAKSTSSLIPLCHQVVLSSVDVDLRLCGDSRSVIIEAEARTAPDARTGVEMEALTAASVSALTVYDMCKAADKGLVIRQVQLTRKSGGRSGEYNLAE